MKKYMVLVPIFVLAIMTSGCLCGLIPRSNPIEADFAMNPSEGNAPLTVQFFSKCSSDDSINLYIWDFGDGNNSGERDPVHTYEIPGEYTVRLKASTTGNRDDSKERILIVHPSDYTPPDETPGDPPVASFTPDLNEGPAPLTVQFTDTSSDTDGTINSWDWDFDDGDISSQQNPSHTFVDVGTYDVELDVTDNDGFSNSTSITIVVTGGTISIFNATADTYVDESNPDMNYGPRTYIMVNDESEIYLEFTGLPAANTVEKAEVKLYNSFRMENGPEVEALTTSSYWNENTVTWNNGMTSAIGSLDTTLANGTQQWFSWDVTAGIKNDMASGKVTIILRAITSGHAQFFTKESNTLYTPKLELTLSS